MRTLLCVAALAACHPQPVIKPDRSPRRATAPEVDSDFSTAPGGMVANKDGAQVDLSGLWATQRVVLVFYIGQWCPHCQKQLADLNEHQGDLAKEGASVAAISADTVADAKLLHDKLALTFDLFSDDKLEVISKWGVEDYDTNVAKPATFIVETGGAISFRKIGTTQADRPTVDQLIAALRTKAP
jgi:peroxiredoxin